VHVGQGLQEAQVVLGRAPAHLHQHGFMQTTVS
jgi:hypothetical protein